MKLKILRASLVTAAALAVLVAALGVWFQGFRFQSDGIFVVMFAICLLAADRAYDWVSKRSRNRIAAYSSAATVLMICAFIMAELMARLGFDNRTSTYRWMAGFGMVTAVAWVFFDLLSRGRLDTSDRWVKPTATGLAIVALLASFWAAFAVPFVRVGRVTPNDCALMAQALKDFSPEGVSGGMRLSSRSNCDWRAVGLPQTSSDTASENGEFHPWFSVEPPVYSLLRTRATLSVGQEWIMLDGEDEDCLYSRTWKGWRRDKCETSWIS